MAEFTILVALASILFGVLILAFPRLLNYIIAVYFILVGAVTLLVELL
ncbi:MAG: DUF3096 domain-containing protein [Candidatus Diapherotrites archaeon]|uniref:DUF3096 domain-containing protein n=1 Tax=Candidatus Iainarchaeum sp. TaxID=3101447 RepID=A0A8T3YI63_9ARCH|nr:DUF3096 domain-containing protein [Candidatus Diapherotrites archaeon]